MPNNNAPKTFTEALPSLFPVLEAAYNAGFLSGFEAGRAVGYIEGVNALKPALSDGLRNGSSECGKAMQGLKSMGALIDDHKP